MSSIYDDAQVYLAELISCCEHTYELNIPSLDEVRHWRRVSNLAHAQKWAAYDYPRFKQIKKARQQVQRAKHNPSESHVQYKSDVISSQEDIEQLYESQKGRCWYCQKKLKGVYHIDHFIPLDKGGTSEIGNLRLACPDCNLAKGNKMPWEFGRLL